MRVLIDECLPRKLKHEFSLHDVHTVPEMGWSGKKNGELLALARGDGFEVLLTIDRRLRDQHDLKTAGIGVVVLIAISNRLSDLTPLVPSIQRELGLIQPGDVVEVR